ncbi:unnamed protein product [Rotaria sp. Silwood1]|nr:unnamed protein product [Rotaria sp. Silwood1]CAF3584580.1 unnamed protein product [Rotaria sp. Silwood1]CAF3634721.1 unnamed protein product [Rotaria sp. Silwood1]CAF4573483.1 unnamed protein product [Rotaria sp. Silwood1]CAF4613353.1 unnamed protein product [Rotaria sp. Silwood1]
MTYFGNPPTFYGGQFANQSTTRYHLNERYNDQVNSSFLSNNLLSDAYTPRSISTAYNPDLSRALRFDAYLLAIVRIEDKRNAFYSAEIVSKLRQKEQTQSFINKPCSLFVTDRSLVIFDRASQVIAETIPLENVDPTCVHADVPDTLNDIFMYRLIDRQLVTTMSNASSTNNNESSSVIVFKCSNNEAKILVDSIRTSTGKPLKNLKSTYIDARNVIERRNTDIYYPSTTIVNPPIRMEPLQFNNSSNIVNTQQTRTTIQPAQTTIQPAQTTIQPARTTIQQAQTTIQPARTTIQQARTTTQQTTIAATDYYKRLTEELNKCFDDIELFVRYLEALMEYTKELERDHRRKEKKSTTGLKQMVEKVPDDLYFIDILQKFKHSFNLLGELKHIIHNPNAPELVHYLLSPLQFILYTLRTKHPNQLKIAQDIWVPGLTKEAKELLLNCLTSKEHDILRNLGPAWVRANDESIPKFSDYRPVFLEGRAVWVQNAPIEYPQPTPLQPTHSTDHTRVTHPFTRFDERQQFISNTTHPSNQNNNNNGISTTYTTKIVQEPSPIVGHFDTSTVDRSVKSTMLENYNSQMQNEHAWAIDRKRAGAKICAVRMDRKGHNNRELTVRRGELIEIEDSSKKWWRARNFHGDVGHVPNNIVEEIEIEHRPLKISPSMPSVTNLHHSLTTTNSRLRNN